MIAVTFGFYTISAADLSSKKKCWMLIPVCTLSPICSSDIVTDFPFSTLTLATDGKQPDVDDITP